MSEASWQTMVREFPAAHVVTGLLPREDAAVGLAEGRSSLLRRLTGALCLSGMYAIAEIVERDGTHIQCALASASDADQLAEAVGASDIGCRSCWASRRRFLFDDAAAKAMGAGARSPCASRGDSAKRQASGVTVKVAGAMERWRMIRRWWKRYLSGAGAGPTSSAVPSAARHSISATLARCWCTTTTRSPLARRLPLTWLAKKASRPRLATWCRCDAAGKVRLVD